MPLENDPPHQGDSQEKTEVVSHFDSAQLDAPQHEEPAAPHETAPPVEAPMPHHDMTPAAGEAAMPNQYAREVEPGQNANKASDVLVEHQTGDSEAHQIDVRVGAPAATAESAPHLTVASPTAEVTPLHPAEEHLEALTPFHETAEQPDTKAELRRLATDLRQKADDLDRLAA